MLQQVKRERADREHLRLQRLRQEAEAEEDRRRARQAAATVTKVATTAAVVSSRSQATAAQTRHAPPSAIVRKADMSKLDIPYELYALLTSGKEPHTEN